MEKDEQLPRWQTLAASEVIDFDVFGVQTLSRLSPRTGRASDFRVLRMPSWVNVVALTLDERLVLVEQYRHGIDELTLELPGGAVESGEDPARAAARELLEETGYGGREPIFLGNVQVNPAIQDNTCSTWLIVEARPVAPLDLDDNEQIRVVTVARSEVPRLIDSGRIAHSLVIAGFHWWLMHERRTVVP